MKDERLKLLHSRVAEEQHPYATPVRINRLKISNYKFFYGEFELTWQGGNMLIYGENGSGKSSIYRAIEFLTHNRFENIIADKNLFAIDAEPQIEFGFSNHHELVIHSDLVELPTAMDFIRGLAVFTPMLDYKKLLRVHYAPVRAATAINIYDMLRNLLQDFPIADGGVLAAIKDFTRYFDSLSTIVNGSLLEEINELIKHFDDEFRISKFRFKMDTNADGRPEPQVTIEIDFKDLPIAYYHTFLNEARLSALAISVYFAVIRKLFGSLRTECLKILVLDDLLISLDMSNRLKLLDILKSRFADFQIFFFTHDRELFELCRNKMEWESFELYLDDSEDIHKPILKKGHSSLERAKVFYAKKDFESCALMLRMEFEKLLKSYLSPREQLDRKCNELDLSSLISKAISKSKGDAKRMLKNLNTDRKHILNPLCHASDRNAFSKEIKNVITEMEKLKDLLI